MAVLPGRASGEGEGAVRAALVAVAVAAVLAFPGGASARSDCTYTRDDSENPAVTVYTQNEPNGSGLSEQADVAAGVCTDSEYQTVPGFNGGAAEVGAGTDDSGPSGAYAIWDGDDYNYDSSNGLVSNRLSGYAGVSNFETEGYRDSCTPYEADNGAGTNSGGCLTYYGSYSVPVPLIACSYYGSWENTARDGCMVDLLGCCPTRAAGASSTPKQKSRPARPAIR